MLLLLLCARALFIQRSPFDETCISHELNIVIKLIDTNYYSAKVPFLAEDALKHINEMGCCVVFGLQGTGEAGLQMILNTGSAQPGSSNDYNDVENINLHHRNSNILANVNANTNTKMKASLNRRGGILSQQDNCNSTKTFTKLMSTVEAGLINFVLQHFPVTPNPPIPPLLPNKLPTCDDERRQYHIIVEKINRIKSLPEPRPDPVLVAKRQELLDTIKFMDLPPNPLDDLIDRLGGVDQVAEMTGRSGRIIRRTNNKDDNKFVYAKRVVDKKSINQSKAAINRDDAASERINIIERRKFMDGQKNVAIISDAASTGIR